ncbi:TonB-dependent receptor [Pelagicoccus sp. SDUM812003]|uniref:TonB-dependent receptor domain-containing protein n=1 Tax=Pelagicoccus sp. SDUM812003 TaxID=3041267 RepID=UPI00280E4956|nr:TonB-dependent receptor [Pelagicoccus sp. SDUM812003]MDQ8202588.1 TonB-dependent receptor [Pelagicoccus sp. SDUM812003]
MTTNLLFKSLAAVSCFGFATLSFAQSDEDEVFDLTPFVVSGETYAFGAQKIVHVTDKDLERLQANDLSDIFSQDPSIMVGGGISAAEKIYVRGIEDKMLAVSVDGATQAGYLSHHQGQYSIEPELLKFAEAEPGAGAASVGPGALAGAIRFENKGANDFLEGSDTFGSFTKASYGSNGDQLKLTGALYSQLSASLSGVFAYTYSESNDYKDGNGDTVELTSSDTNRAFLKLDGQIDANQTLEFSFEDRSNEGTFRHRPNFYGDFNHPRAPNDPVYMEFDRQTATLGYGFVASDRNVDLNAKLYHTDNSIDRTGQYEMGYESLGFDLSNTSAYGDHTVNYGLNFRDDTAYFTGKGQTTLRPPFSSPIGLPPLVYQTIPDETIEILGFYAQDEWQVTEQVQASFGIRWDEYKYQDKDGQTFRDAGFSPNLGISFAATEKLDLNVSYGTAFRGVTPIDLITANEGGVTNHASIDPEWAENAEIGFQYDNGTYFANGTLYQQTINDVIVSSGVRDNAGDLEVEGYDFTFGLRQGAFTSSLGVSHSDPELDGEALVDTDFGLGSSYGRTWNANTGYTFSELQLNVGWSLNFVEEYDESPEPLAYKPSYAVHDFYAQWVTGEEDHIAVTLTIDNAFDKYYVDQATAGYNGQLERVAGLAAPGRDIRLSTSIKF